MVDRWIVVYTFNSKLIKWKVSIPDQFVQQRYNVSHEYNLKISRNILKKEKAGEINFNLI